MGDLVVPLDFVEHKDEKAFSEKVFTQGALVFSITWEPVPAYLLSRGRLTVRLIRGNGLALDAAASGDSHKAQGSQLVRPSTYVTLRIAGRTLRSQRIKRSSEPKYERDQSFTWEGVLRDLIAMPLELHAWLAIPRRMPTANWTLRVQRTASSPIRSFNHLLMHCLETRIPRFGQTRRMPKEMWDAQISFP